MKVVAMIPARGGSRGVERKNLAPVAGRPLLAWTIDAARSANTLSRVVVSSDDKEILALSAGLGADALARPAALATDDARTEGVVLHALQELEGDYDALVVLQPTSPLRTHWHIDQAVALLGEEVDAVISVVEPEKSPFKAFALSSDRYLVPVSADKEAPFRPRQQLPRAFFPNGAIYLVRVDVFRPLQSFLPPRTVPYPMSPEVSLDVDSEADLMEADRRLGRVGAADPSSQIHYGPAGASLTEPMSNFFKVSR